VRPVAVGDTIRRLVGKALLSTAVARGEVSSLQPLQLSVSCQNGMEFIALGVQSIVDTHHDDCPWAILHLDLKNAFNSVSRDAILPGTLTHTPSLVHYLAFAYAQHVPLYSGG